MTELSEVEINLIEFSLNLCERCDLTADVFNARDIRVLLNMAMRPTADENTERLKNELDERNTELTVARVEIERLIEKNRKLEERLELALKFWSLP